MKSKETNLAGRPIVRGYTLHFGGSRLGSQVVKMDQSDGVGRNPNETVLIGQVESSTCHDRNEKKEKEK